MISPRLTGFYFVFILLVVFTLSCGDSPPKPGQDISLKEFDIHIVLHNGWEGEVTGTDWTMWRRVKRGTAEEPWVIPPITVTNTGAGPMGVDERVMSWRFKGVEGRFDPQVNPETSQYPVPPGLWSLDPQKLELQETQSLKLPFMNREIRAVCRLYENAHGFGASESLWHTYTITFPIEEYTFEFVLSIPDTASTRDWQQAFWDSINKMSMSDKP